VAAISYLTLGDYCLIAAEVLGITPEQVARLPRIPLAESALATPAASFAGQDAYPALIEKAAVLVEHLARNHPLPDGNKRCAFLAVERFLAANGRPIQEADPDTDVPMVERIAAGEARPNEIVSWLENRAAPSVSLGHPTRIRLLEAMGGRTISPYELARELGVLPGEIAYHFLSLAKLGVITVVGSKQIRGATVHYYRATDPLEASP